MNVLSWAGVVIGSLFLIIIIICYIRHLIVFGIDLPCSTLKTDYFGRPYPESSSQVADNDVQNFDPDEAARGNKYYPILTADEARRSSASASTLKHLLEDHNSKMKAKVTAIDSSIDEEEAESSQNSFKASQVQEDDYSDTLGTLEETKEGEIASSNLDQPEDRTTLPKNGGVAKDCKSAVIDIHENATGKEVRGKNCAVHLDEEASPISDGIKKCDEKTSYHQKIFQVPRISCDEPSGESHNPVLLTVPDANFMQAKFSRNKSKSLREYKQRLGSANNCTDKKRLSLDRFLTAQCQYCMIEEMVANSMAKRGIKPTNDRGAGINKQQKISRGQSFDTPACVRASPIPAMTLAKTPAESNDAKCFDQESPTAPISPGIGYARTAAEFSHDPHASCSSQAGVFNHAHCSKYDMKGIEVVTQDNLPVFDSRRTSCESTTNPLYKRQSPSNSYGGPEDPCNASLLHPNLQMRRTRSTRERRTSPKPSVNTCMDQRNPVSPRGGSFRDRRTTRRKSSPRLTSFEDFQNFSLLMAGHKVEIPSWKEHKNISKIEDNNNSSQDGDVSS